MEQKEIIATVEAVAAMQERAHHPFSPSTLQSREACPCWSGKQSLKPHPRTIIGTLSHAVTETGEDNEELGDEDIEKVAECMDFFESRKRAAAELRLKEGGDKRAENIEIKETYLPVDDITFPDGAISTTAGYIDCGIILYDQSYAELFDWKFGMWPVEAAENNLQGIAYTLGLMKKYPKLRSVRFWFKQPNIDLLDSHVFTRESAEALYLRVQVVVARARLAKAQVAKGDFSMANPMVPACNFCELIGKCPKVAEFACRIGSKFHPMEIPSSITPSEVLNEKDTKLGLTLSGVMAVWAAAFKSTITDRILRRDMPCPEGFRIQSRTPRKIADAEKYKKVALRHLTPEEYEKTLKPSFGKVEEKISDKAPRGQKSAAVEAFATELVTEQAVEIGDSFSFLAVVNGKK